MNVFAFSVSMPPSANNMFATYNNRRIISREYKAWREKEEAAVFEAWLRQGAPAFERPVGVTIHLGLGFRGDIDNRIKPIIDLLGKAIGDFPNDRYINRIEVERVPGIDGARVLVMQLGQEARSIGEIVAPIMDRIEANLKGEAA